MDLETNSYYHIYNRSNNREVIFQNSDNYLYFLRKFRNRFEELVTVFAYCLMPTHFHFLIKVETTDADELKKRVGIQLSSYTKAFNNYYNRNGSLFQQQTKEKLITDKEYLITLITYIHQNPIRAGLVKDLRDWPYSSYPDLAGYRNGDFVDKSFIEDDFASVEDFRLFSNQTIKNINKNYWI